jgi:tetratricopeptide (TPR) repeat protein
MPRTAFVIAGLAFASPALAAPTEELRAPLAAGAYTTAIERADRVLATAPDDAEARFVKGVALAELSRRAEAIALFEGLTRDLPQRPEPWNNLAVLYAQRGDWDRARDALEQALRTSETYRTAHDNLGMVYATLAGQAYRKALALDGSGSDAPKLALLETIVVPPPGPKPVPAAPKLPAAEPKIATAEPVVATAPKATASKPAAPSPPATEVAAAADGVRSAVSAWAAAWREQDVDAYLASYVPDFAPGGLSHAAWAAQRRARIGAPKRIELTLSNLNVAERGPDAATASFTQDYRSDTFTGVTRKTLELVRRDGRWLISAERTGR